MGDVFSENAERVLLPEDNHVVQTFSAHAAEITLAGRIRLRCSHGGAHDPDAARLGDAIEVAPELVVVVANDEPQASTEWGSVPQLLCRPQAGW